MEKIRTILIIGLLLSHAAFAQIKVACIGNSITYGFGYDHPKSYPTQLNSILGGDWEVKNFGVPGATMLRNGDNPYYKLKAYADAQGFNPDVVIIKLGTNDSKPQNWQYKDEFEKDYNSMIAELKALPSQPFIILCTPVPAYSHGWGIRDSVVKEEIPIVEKLVKDNHLKLINLYQPLSNHADWFPDGIHPNEYGLKKMATVIAASLQQFEKEIMNRLKGPKLGEASVAEVITAMTAEEKAAIVTGTGMPGANKPAIGSTQLRVPGAAGTTMPLPRLGIPALVFADGPAGLRIRPRRINDTNTYYCTAFPIASLLSSTWDLELVKQVGNSIGNEALEYGVDVLLAPALNLHRNPLGGRNFEYYAEDPLLSGKIAAAYVNGVQSNGVGCSIKHFAANNQEANREHVNVIVSERALQELYLKGFQIAAQEAKPWTVMSAYNKINGSYSSQSKDLLVNKLRKLWGYQGVVMTDWFAGDNPIEQMNAGNNLLMPGSQRQRNAIVKGLNDGSIDVQQLDENIQDILKLVLQSPTYKGYHPSNKPDLKAHTLLARQAATEGMVLLKNNNQALPLKKLHQKIAVFGVAGYTTYIGGTGSGEVNAADSVSLVEGLKQAGFLTDEKLKVSYETYIKNAEANRKPPVDPYMPLSPIGEMFVEQKQLDKAAKENDLVIFTIGRYSGEFADRKVEEDFNLSHQEQAMIKDICTAFHQQKKKVIVVLNIGGVIETASWKNLPDAILLAWQPGQEAGNAIADIISGKVNPSGKLPVSFPVNYQDVSSAKNFPGIPDSLPEKVDYKEDIYVGYRYFNTYGIKTSYPFGYGLSYTGFLYSNLKLSQSIFHDQITVSFRITNMGKVAGKEVVECYLHAPVVKLSKPANELKAFVKTRLLKPGESQNFSITLQTKDLVSFDTSAASWTAEKGTYQIRLGASVEDIRLSTSFQLTKDITTSKVSY